MDVEIAQAPGDCGLLCIRMPGSQTFVSLFPVLKPMVERWIYSERPFEAGALPEVLERLELDTIPGEYPAAVSAFKRSRVTRLGLLATNLHAWTSDEELAGSNSVSVPTRSSEWGRLLSWLQAEVPSALLWEQAQNAFRSISTRDLLDSLLQQNIGSERSLESIKVLREQIKSNECGLPFMEDGALELTGVPTLLHAFQPKERLLHRPVLQGSTRAWPMLLQSGETTLLERHVPVVAVRPAWPAQLVQASIRTLEIPTQGRLAPPRQHDKAAPPENGRRSWFQKVFGRGKASNAEQPTRTTMSRRCCYCYGELTEAQLEANQLYCRPAGMSAYEHVTALPLPRDEDERIHARYRHLTASNPDQIAVASLVGAPKQGKSVFLSSLIGTMVYPINQSRFWSMFPPEWNVIETNQRHARSADDNLQLHTEKLWIDGNAPERNDLVRHALLAPRLFKRDPRPGLQKRSSELIVVLNDTPGEVIHQPLAMDAPSQNTHHLEFSTDIVFIVDAQSLVGARQSLDVLTFSLGAALKTATQQMNLIFVITKFELLANSSVSANRQLFEEICQTPAPALNRPDVAEFQEYVRGVQSVDSNIQTWLEAEAGELYKVAHENYRTVRCCGVSALGFEPIRLGKMIGSEARLPFQPKPFRVLDPLLWILLEHGFLPECE